VDDCFEAYDFREIILSALRCAFDHVWERLAEEGACDALGGAEYRRVYREWTQRRYPRPIAPFIRQRANIGPTDPERSEP
jgi:hypothetical protein